MHKFWRLISRSTAVAMISSAVLALSSSGALAQASKTDDVMRKYLITAPAQWGGDQDQAIMDLGGTIEFRHSPSGIGVVSSNNPNFIRLALRGGAFVRAAEDMDVQWVLPGNEQALDEGISPEVVTPGNDNFINLLWNMTAIEAAGAWSLGYDGQGVRVAVIDGGICATHPDLAANIDAAASRSFVPGFGYGDDTGGPGAFRHACHVAGIIAAVDNSIGTIGVAPQAKIIACKALHGGSGSFGAVIQAILYASDPITAGGGGAHIINMSLGATFAKGGGNNGTGALVAAMAKAVNYATANNVLVVCSAGNSAIDFDHAGSLTHVPSQSGSAIAVSATAPEGFAVGWPSGATNYRAPAGYTNYGRSVIWAAAPGGDSRLPGSVVCSIPRIVGPPVTTACWVFDLVLSPGNTGGSYFFASGTSMASPHVAGVAALIAGKYPGISVGDLKTRLIQTADDEGANGTDPFYGHGFVNARRAVTEGAAQPAAQEKLAETATRVELVIARNAASSLPSIAFMMPVAGEARVELFDVAGRNVAMLFDGVAAAGRTTLSWDGRGSDGESLRGGVYFARLTAGGVRAARQILLLGH